MTPPTSLGYTATPANANLDTLPQIPAVLGALPANVVAALAAFNVIPVVADAAARDALIPAPAANQRVERADTGFRERYAGGQWTREGVLRTVGPYVSAFAKGAKGDGVTDDSAVVTALSAAIAASGKGDWDPATYLINGNVTLDGYHHVNVGGSFFVAAGKTLTIAPTCFLDARHQIFQGPGAVVFTQARQALRPGWWGEKADRVNDDGPAWNRMFASVIDGGVVELQLGTRRRFATTAHMPRRADWTIRSESSSLVTAFTPAIYWDGAYGGRCFNVWRCSNVQFEGLRIEPIPLSTTVHFDGSANVGAPNTISLLVDTPFSAAGVSGPEVGRGVVIFGAGANGDPLLARVTASPTAGSLTIDTPIQTTVSPTRVYLMPAGTLGFFGATAIDFCGDPNGLDFMYGLNITNGQTRVTVTEQDHPTWYHGKRNVVFPDMVGRTIHIPGAGVAGAPLTTTIATVIDGITFTVANAASTTVNNVVGTAEPMVGIGVNGASNIGTRPAFRRMFFHAQVRHPRVEFVRLSIDTQSNWEFGAAEDNEYYGGDGSADVPSTGIVIAGGSLNLATCAAGFRVGNPVGYRVRIEGAGVAGAVYDGIITAYNAGTHTATISPPASTAVGAAFGLVSEWEGIGIALGQSANAHGHKFYRNIFSNVGVWVYALNGGFDCDAAIGAGGQYCFYVAQSTRLVRVFNTIVQNVGTFFQGGNSTFGVQLNGNNIGDCGCVPGTAGGVIAAAVSAFSLKNNSFDTTSLDGVKRKVYDHSLITSGYWKEEDTNISGAGSPFTKAQIGYTTTAAASFPSYYTLSNINGCSDIGGRLIVQGIGNVPPIAAEVSSASSPGNAQVRCITGIGRTSSDPTEVRGVVGKLASRLDSFASDATLTAHDAGVEGLISVDFGPLNHPSSAVQAQIRWEPTSFNNSVNVSTPYHAMRVKAPVFLNSGGSLPIVPLIYGLRLEQQWQDGTHTPDVRGVWQESVNEPNLLSGLSTFGSGKVEKATVFIDIGAAGNATPNPAGAESYRYRIAGAATINAPINPVDGMTFTMEIFNNTGGAITPTLNAIFLGTGYGAIGAGKSRSRRWQYDANVTKWKPLGAVSEDF